MQAAGDHDVGARNGWTRLTAVGIDKDKNSQQAVKWAVDHLLINDQSIILVHVRQKALNYGFSMAEATPEATRQQIEADNTQLFLPYRGFCARKGVNVTEVVLEDTDVSKALIEYISMQHIHNFVVGVANRNALTKKFRTPDVSATMVKNAPDFCAVYVISKGKAVTVRSAKGPVPMNSSPQKKNIDPDDSIKTPFTRGSKKGSIPAPPLPPDQMKSATHLPGAKPAAQALTPRDSTDSSRRGLLRESLGSRDFSDDLYYSGMAQSGSDYSICQDSPPHSNVCSGDSSPTSSSKRDLEAEMKRLKLELKQTMNMYSNACKEAITAKQQAKEFHQWKLEEARKFEEARSAGEAALAVAEMEKARCKAAIEAAEAAKRKAEIEEKKRRSAEYKALREAEEKKRALDALAQNDTRYRKYSIDEIELATEYFSKSLKIGEGGYGPVFRACLDHTPVAIKVLRPDASQGRKQFNQEVEVLSCIRHPNMVLLLGACPEYGCLVYEYMDNGSLEDRLMRRGNTPPIPWPTRFKIAAEIATALLFLHQSKPEPLVHRDLKPGNILLDRNYVSKISDVGLARLVPPSIANQVTQYRMTSTAGTLCYIDPEYQQTGMLGCKSDVYSLGVMLLQIITARPPMGLSHHVERAISKGTFEEMLDPTVKDWPVEECLSYAKLALKCSELRRKDRPDLGTVVLPELNRLRNLGHAYENTVGFCSGGGGIYSGGGGGGGTYSGGGGGGSGTYSGGGGGGGIYSGGGGGGGGISSAGSSFAGSSGEFSGGSFGNWGEFSGGSYGHSR